MGRIARAGAAKRTEQSLDFYVFFLSLSLLSFSCSSAKISPLKYARSATMIKAVFQDYKRAKEIMIFCAILDSSLCVGLMVSKLMTAAHYSLL